MQLIFLRVIKSVYGQTNLVKIDPVEANSTRMPTWIDYNSNESLMGKPVVKFTSQPDKSLNLQSPIVEPALVFLLARQNVFEESQIFGGDLITTNENGFFSLSYNQNNPSISSVQPANIWNICVMELPCPRRISGLMENMGSGSQTVSTNPFDTIARSFDGEIAELLIFLKT